MTEEIKPDLFDTSNEDNFKLLNLVDDAKWQQLKKEYNEGKGKPIED